MTDASTWLAMVTSGWSDIGQPTFWVALLKIMWINVLLSGDNAVVIAMACLGLPPRQRMWGMILGAGVVPFQMSTTDDVELLAHALTGN